MKKRKIWGGFRFSLTATFDLCAYHATHFCVVVHISNQYFFTYLLAFLDGQNSIKLLYPALEDCKFFVRTNALFCWYKLKILYYVHVPYLKVELVEEVVV